MTSLGSGSPSPIRALGATLLSATALLVAACGATLGSGDAVDGALVAEHGPAAPLRSPATFDYHDRCSIEVRDPRYDTFEIERALRQSVEERLAARGVRRAPGGTDIDYDVGYFLIADDAALLDDLLRASSTTGEAVPGARVPRGALVLTVHERESGALVWHGVVEGALEPERTTAERGQRTAAATERLLERL